MDRSLPNGNDFIKQDKYFLFCKFSFHLCHWSSLIISFQVGSVSQMFVVPANILFLVQIVDAFDVFCFDLYRPVIRLLIGIGTMELHIKQCTQNKNLTKILHLKKC